MKTFIKILDPTPAAEKSSKCVVRTINLGLKHPFEPRGLRLELTDFQRMTSDLQASAENFEVVIGCRDGNTQVLPYSEGIHPRKIEFPYCALHYFCSLLSMSYRVLSHV